ncbi:MAG: helix-turn-helix domain-containing protein [Nocardioidaceae bacterium]
MTLVDHTNEGATTGAATLRTILDALGVDLLHALVAPAGLDLEVTGTSIYDPADPMPDGEGRVLLLVGTRADSSEAPVIVRDAAEHGHVAAVIKTRGGDPSALVAEASLHDLAILETADDLPWRHLDGLLVSVLGARRLSAGLTTSGGEALFVLANALGGTIGGSVAIEDLEQHVLAYSSIEGQRIDPLRERGILDRQVPDYPHHRAQYLQVLRDSGVSRFPALEEEFPRAAVAIRAGDMPLGTIWAIEDERGLDPAGEQALLEAARIAAMHMLRGQDLTEREQRLRGEVLRSVLAGGRPIDDADEKLGLTAGSEISLIAFASHDTDQQGPLLTRLGVAAARYVLAYRPEAVTTTTTRGVYVLVPGSGEAAHRLAGGALRSLTQASGSTVRAAVSAVTRDVRDLPALRAETDAVLRAAASDDRAPAVATVADVHSRILLDRVARELASDPRLRHPGIQEMSDHDREHGTTYARSMQVWLDCQGDVGAAATRLQVHANTLRYRLRRAQERFGLDLEDPDVRLSMWLQLRLEQHRPHN